MNELTPSNVHAFFKRFQFHGGRLRRFRISSGKAAVAELRVAVRDTQANADVRLRLTFTGVEEYRFQRRPSLPPGRLKEVRVGFFGPLAYLNLDAFPEDGPPKVMDFRASDCFVAGRTMTWELLETRAK